MTLLLAVVALNHVGASDAWYLFAVVVWALHVAFHSK